jgi:hypothetical protein
MNTFFDTTDIVLAAYLFTVRCPLVKVTMQGNRGTFQFSGVDPSLISTFDLGQALVEPATFNNSVKHLTSACRRNKD